MRPEEELAWMRLARSENVGPATFFNLINRFGSAEEALRQAPGLARNAGGRAIKLISPATVAREREAIARLGGLLLTPLSADYPPLLRQIPDAPPVLVALGHPHLLARPAIAIVGGRSASLPARKLASHLAERLGEAGLTVVSGLALGIDTAAHQGALASGTVAMVAGGLKLPYPPQNEALHWRIAEAGLLCSEDWLDAPHTARKFPRRNRLIAGSTLGTVVIEAKVQSGTLITARLANDYGREVFAVPGFPGDPRNQGSNALIKSGAKLVEVAEDILEELEALRQRTIQPSDNLRHRTVENPQAPLEIDQQAVDALRTRVEQLLGAAPVSIDELIDECQCTAHLLLAALAELELAGRLERHPGNRVAQMFDPRR